MYSLIGATHDAFVRANCDLKQRFERGEFGDYLLIGEYLERSQDIMHNYL